MTLAILITIFLLLFFLVIGMPVAFALGSAGAIGLLLVNGFDLVSGILQTTPYSSAASFVLTAVPMFILMAEFATVGGMTNDIFVAAYRWLGSIRGGLAIATVVACAVMAAVSGSSTASAAAMAKIAIPEMRKYRYSDVLSAGVVCVAGTLAIMIPPSIILILYGIMTETPIAQLLIAGVVPGVITALGYIISIYFWVRSRPEIAPVIEPFSIRERLGSLKRVWPMLLLIVSVLLAIYSGVVTPTEAGAFGSFIAFLIAVIIYSMRFGGLKEALSRTAVTTGMIFTIIIGAMIFGYFLTYTRVTQNLIRFVGSLGFDRWVILTVIILIYILLGMFMDQLAILFLTVPLTFPLAVSLGFDPIWFGIIITKTAEIGLVTPPVGMNVYVAASTARVPIEVAFRGTGRLLLVEFVVLLLLVLFPSLATWLPGVMGF
ncbi:MAG: TRAP transporter large permease [Desulfotomaculales bacterium]